MRSICKCAGYSGTVEAAPEHQKSKTEPDRTPESSNNGVHSGSQEPAGEEDAQTLHDYLVTHTKDLPPDIAEILNRRWKDL